MNRDSTSELAGNIYVQRLSRRSYSIDCRHTKGHRAVWKGPALYPFSGLYLSYWTPVEQPCTVLYLKQTLSTLEGYKWANSVLCNITKNCRNAYFSTYFLKSRASRRSKGWACLIFGEFIDMQETYYFVLYIIMLYTFRTPRKYKLPNVTSLMRVIYALQCTPGIIVDTNLPKVTRIDSLINYLLQQKVH